MDESNRQRELDDKIEPEYDFLREAGQLLLEYERTVDGKVADEVTQLKVLPRPFMSCGPSLTFCRTPWSRRRMSTMAASA